MLNRNMERQGVCEIYGAKFYCQNNLNRHLREQHDVDSSNLKFFRVLSVTDPFHQNQS